MMMTMSDVQTSSTNKVSVEQFINELKAASQGCVGCCVRDGNRDFAENLIGGAKVSGGQARRRVKRTRLSEGQKNSLKGIIVSVLSRRKRRSEPHRDRHFNISNDLLNTVQAWIALSWPTNCVSPSVSWWRITGSTPSAKALMKYHHHAVRK